MCVVVVLGFIDVQRRYLPLRGSESLPFFLTLVCVVFALLPVLDFVFVVNHLNWSELSPIIHRFLRLVNQPSTHLSLSNSYNTFHAVHRRAVIRRAAIRRAALL